uniref:hypothetical protein n=1 Tax=Parerythrobacter lutipelagi TaxID=1964208 RepID=UPI0010F5819B|nr:hypothetical protein [Parerythrobacter lutipelagi]
MGNPRTLELIQDYEAAREWWQLAGVDCEFENDATDWLAEPEQAPPADAPAMVPKQTKPARPAAPEIPRVQFGGEKSAWPVDIAKFQSWWVDSPDVDGGGSYPLIAPRGNAGASLMVIVPEPEQTDRDALLSGPDGKLLASFLSAAAISPDSVYLASVLMRHTPLPEWKQLKADGVGELLAHHISLVAPKRILAFGRNILPLLSHDTAQDPPVLQDFNHDRGSVALMGAATLGELLRSVGRRKQFWRRWLDWTEG